MSIETLDKVTLVGHLHNKNEVLTGLQELGCLHLIPLTPEGKATGTSGPSRDAREALRFIASASPRRRQASNPRNFDAARIEQQALELQRRHFELLNRRDFISSRIDNLAAWGDFEFPSVEELGGNRLWFYLVPHHEMRDVANTGQRWQVTHTDQRYCYVVVVSPDEPEDMPAARLHTGGVSRHRLIEELEEVESELEDVEAERLGLTRWCTLFARALDGLEDRAARAQASAQTAEVDPVYALQAWVPRSRMDELRVYARAQTLALQVTQPDSAEQPPTLFSNPAPLRAGEDLVAFYMTPSYWLWDPSSVVFVSFALFFAMIVADAGYALLLAGVGLASASLAITFNDMAGDVREAMPGLGFLFALLILILGHGLNFLLSVASGFIHGLRLNVIEFFKWGVKDEGNPYRPFDKKESS